MKVIEIDKYDVKMLENSESLPFLSKISRARAFTLWINFFF